jgi:hypothetical protein
MLHVNCQMQRNMSIRQAVCLPAGRSLHIQQGRCEEWQYHPAGAPHLLLLTPFCRLQTTAIHHVGHCSRQLLDTDAPFVRLHEPKQSCRLCCWSCCLSWRVRCCGSEIIPCPIHSSTAAEQAAKLPKGFQSAAARQRCKQHASSLFSVRD